MLDLIDANYTFLNEPLVKHYGIGDRFVLRTDDFASLHAGADDGEIR